MMLYSTLDQDRAMFLLARQQLGTELVAAWPRDNKELRRVQVDVKWVRFSTRNHRTQAEQLREQHRRQKPELFTADPLGLEAQEAQYKILRSQEGFDALKKDLRERRQQEPAIVTADGVLINGNRRSAALRSLYEDDNVLTARYVSCLVLPADATADELLDLEAELQVARDFKEDYSWINAAMLIEELYDRERRDYSRVAARMHRDTAYVQDQHQKLQQVHQLVALSGGTRLHIDFKDNESAFAELYKHVRNKPAGEAQAVQDVYFLGTLAGVKYRELRHLRRSDAAALVAQELAAEPALKALLELADSQAVGVGQLDPLDELLGEQDSPSSVQGLLSLLASTRPEEMIALASGERFSAQDVLDTVRSAITSAAEEAEEEQRDQTAVQAPVIRLKKALVELERAHAALYKARNYEDWDEQTFRAELQVVLRQVAALGA